MTPRQMWREGGLVEVEQLTHYNLAATYAWLRERGVVAEFHRNHGLMLVLDSGPLAVNYGEWLTVSWSGHVAKWDNSEFKAEHREESA